MKHLLSILVILASFSAYSQTAIITSPDVTVCFGDSAVLSSCTSVAGGSPIVNSIWSVFGSPGTFSGSTAPCKNFKVLLPIGTYTVSLINQHQNGTTSQTQEVDFITVSPNVTADISATVTSCNIPFGVQYGIGGSTPGITYNWTFQSGNPATFNGATPPIINYSTAGTYNVGLTVTNPTTGCTASTTKAMNVANFSSAMTIPTTACEGTPVQFNDNSTVGVNQWNWTIVNPIGGSTSPSSSTSEDPSFVFNLPGVYTINLASSNTSVPCNSTATGTITILAKPKPSFVASPTLGCAPLVVNYSNTTQNAAGATFSWNYGDGSPIFNGQNSPSHTYTGNGSFTTTLTMTGSNGCINTADTLILLQSPIANFTADIKDGCAGVNVQFTDISTTPTTISNWFWDFGDGTTSTLQNPTHSYACGEFDVRLIIIIPGGCNDTIILSHGAIPFNGGLGYETSATGADSLLLTYGEIVTPNFMVDHHNDCINQPFILTDLTDILCPHDPQAIQRTWFFNGVPSSGSKIYTKTFPDTMQNIGPNGLIGTDIDLEIKFRNCLSKRVTFDSIYISAPISRFSIDTLLFCDVNQTLGLLNKTIRIDDSQSIYGHKWLNNVLPLNPKILDSTVANLAFDNIKLTYRWGDGTPDFIEDTDSFLEDHPNKGATVDPNNPTLTSTTKTIAGDSITHTFENYGTYEVWQIIENIDSRDTPITPNFIGCKDSTMITVRVSWVSTDYVFDEPVGQINDFDSVCLNNPFAMNQTSSTHNIHQPMSYSFTSSGPSPFSASGVDPQIKFPGTLGTAGVYPILLTTTNAVGCSATATGELTVFALPQASFTLSQDKGCKYVPYTTNATNTSTHPTGSYQAGTGSANWMPNGFSWTINSNSPVTTANYGDIFGPTNITDNTNFSLTVTDAFGCVSLPASATAIVQQPFASITAASQICNSDLASNSISFNGNGNIQTYQWTIDGVVSPLTTSSIPFPASWTIPQGGPTSQTHTIDLIITDTDGCKDTLDAVKNVTILAPQAQFTDVKAGTAIAGQTNTFNCPPVVVNFTDASLAAGSSPIVSWAWQFGILGDPTNTITNSTKQNPTGIQYLFPGTYGIRFIIQDATGCISEYYDPNYLTINGPSAESVITKIPGICGQEYKFEVTNKSLVTSWTWSLGDGSTELSSNNPADTFHYTYNGVTTYYPVLSVEDATGCVVKYFDTITVLPNGVTAFFTGDPLTGINLGTTVVFDDGSTTIGTGNIVTWIWNFGDGRIDTLTNGNNVSNAYFIGGEVPVSLLVIDDRGCKDDYSIVITVDVKFDFPNVLTGHGKGDRPNADFALFADVMKDFSILIVNRWGNVVYEGVYDATRPRYLWDGIDLKSGKLCQDGTYFYKFKGTLKNDVPVDINGFLTLIGTDRP